MSLNKLSKFKFFLGSNIKPTLIDLINKINLIIDYLSNDIETGEMNLVFDGVETIKSIPHNLESIPSFALLSFQDMTDVTIRAYSFTLTKDSIEVTFANAPIAGTNKIYYLLYK